MGVASTSATQVAPVTSRPLRRKRAPPTPRPDPVDVKPPGAVAQRNALPKSEKRKPRTVLRKKSAAEATAVDESSIHVNANLASASTSTITAELSPSNNMNAPQTTPIVSYERRLARFREKSPKTVNDRLKRVMTQRMFLVNRQKIGTGVHPLEIFKVLGSTGNVYTITIGLLPNCDCPDCSKGNVPCKHILFVFLKVLKVPENSFLWFQKALLSEELRSVFENAPPVPHATVAVSAAVRSAFFKASEICGENVGGEIGLEASAVAASGKRLACVGDDCPVCYEEMSAEDEATGKLTYDEALVGCGKALHTECFQMWVKTTLSKGDSLTCVWCRAPWPAPVAKNAAPGKTGGSVNVQGRYINMADVAGMSRVRDTSTYYWGPMRGKALWESRYDDD